MYRRGGEGVRSDLQTMGCDGQWSSSDAGRAAGDLGRVGGTGKGRGKVRGAKWRRGKIRPTQPTALGGPPLTGPSSPRPPLSLEEWGPIGEVKLALSYIEPHGSTPEPPTSPNDAPCLSRRGFRGKAACGPRWRGLERWEYEGRARVTLGD